MPDREKQKRAENTDKSEQTLPIKRRKVRRKLLKSLVGGGAVAGASGLPGRWKKPLVETVVLPAHAGMSLSSPSCIIECRIEVEDGEWSFSGGSHTLNGNDHESLDIDLIELEVSTECFDCEKWFNTFDGTWEQTLEITVSGATRSGDPEGPECSTGSDSITLDYENTTINNDPTAGHNFDFTFDVNGEECSIDVTVTPTPP